MCLCSLGLTAESADSRAQSIDLTELAREGKLDPVIGRDEGMILSDVYAKPYTNSRDPSLEIRRTIQSEGLLSKGPDFPG